LGRGERASEGKMSGPQQSQGEKGKKLKMGRSDTFLRLNGKNRTEKYRKGKGGQMQFAERSFS